ncbi:MAG: tRNA (adenosine(37)-N6)-dimethylallyltransferase MiaA [Candidatus Riflebacteria bacterium]|nr:tRNA (adenosine(37)-N6)-dimethylallyltransferase MiaA [Candidatus Riflebacteria bacterium]
MSNCNFFELPPPLLAILGPTAAGKTGLSVKLSEYFNVEVINCDSRQVYREMDIGTAKPTPDERQKVTHHFLDIIAPDESFNAGHFVACARPLLAKIWSEKKTPLVVGGTGFYFDALIQGLPEIGENEAIRNELQEAFFRNGIGVLLKELSKLDPEAAEHVDVANPRRLLRALEMIKLSGLSLKEIEEKREKLNARVLPFLINLPRNLLVERIYKRVDEMIESGLENEAKTLFEKYGEDAEGLNTIGYHEWRDYWEGKTKFSETVESIKIHTRQYAKRQVTWFKKRPGGDFLDPSEAGTFDAIVQSIKTFLDFKTR